MGGMKWRAIIAFAFAVAFELYGAAISPTKLSRIIVRALILAFLFWQIGRGKEWPRWVVGILIIVTVATLAIYGNLLSPRILTALALLTITFALVAWPKPKKKVP